MRGSDSPELLTSARGRTIWRRLIHLLSSDIALSRYTNILSQLPVSFSSRDLGGTFPLLRYSRLRDFGTWVPLLFDPEQGQEKCEVSDGSLPDIILWFGLG